jgi:hypothetical protein
MAQALGIFGLLSAGAGFPGGGKPPAFGGAAVATITGAAASATSAALGGSLLGGAIGNSANDIFKHYFASDETTNNSGGNSTEPENQNRYGEDLYWEDALKNKGKIMVGGDIIPGRKPILNSKGELLSKDNSPTRGIFRAVTAAGQVIRERIASIGAYDTQKKQGIRTLNKEYLAIIVEEYGITDRETINAIRISLEHAEGRAALDMRINNIKKGRLTINNTECYYCQSPIDNLGNERDAGNAIRYILGENKQLGVVSPIYDNNGNKIGQTGQSYTGIRKNVGK